MLFILFLGAALLLAFAIEPFCSAEGDVPGAERLGLILLLGFALLMAANWGLAFAHLLSAKALLLCGIGYALAGAGLLYRRRDQPWRLWQPVAAQPLRVLILAAFGLVCLALIMRGSLLFVMEFDALTYHFPKAVEIIRAQAIPNIPSGDFRVAYFPWNYELLLADGLLLARGDHLSYVIGLLATLGFCALAMAALRRAWPSASSLEALLGVVLVCATPVLILQSADHKNDVLFAFYFLSTLYWLTIWCQAGRVRELYLAYLSFTLSFGTKSTVLFLLPVLPFLFWHFRSRFALPATGGARKVLVLAAGAGSLLMLMGSGWPLLNLVRCGHLLGEMATVGGLPGFEANAVPHYNGWSNLWTFPLLAILRPFSTNIGAVWVFWKHQYWWWPAYHPIYSHFGWLCSCLLLLLPLGIWHHRKRPDAGKGFRSWLTLLTLAFVVLSLPQRYRVDGMFCGFPRYLLCIPILVALWALLPALIGLREAGWRRLCSGLGIGLVATFLGQSFYCLKLDASKPIALVWRLFLDPGLRPDGGMAFQFDRSVRSTDAVAFDSGFGGMSYPLYGEHLTRPLIYLKPGVGPQGIPAEVVWVVIDRSWNVGWSHPGVTDTSQFWLPMQRAETQEDLALVKQLSSDPGFVLIVNDPANNQFVFRRRTRA